MTTQKASLIGQRAEYLIGSTDSGTGIIKTYNDETDMVTIVDEDDGSAWLGPFDKITLLPSSEADQ